MIMFLIVLCLVAQLGPTLRDLMDCSPPGSSVHGIFQVRVPVSPYMCVCSVAQSCLTLCSPMDCSPPGSSVHGIFQQEYWSGLPFPPPEDFPDPGIKPASLIFPALAGVFFTY